MDLIQDRHRCAMADDMWDSGNQIGGTVPKNGMAIMKYITNWEYDGLKNPSAVLEFYTWVSGDAGRSERSVIGHRGVLWY